MRKQVVKFRLKPSREAEIKSLLGEWVMKVFDDETGVEQIIDIGWTSISSGDSDCCFGVRLVRPDCAFSARMPSYSAENELDIKSCGNKGLVIFVNEVASIVFADESVPTDPPSKTVVTLWCYRLGCDRLPSFAKWVQLKELDLTGCDSIMALDTISVLSNLRHLSFSCARLVDVGAISMLRDISRLSLDGCKILSDIDVVSGLTKLTYLTATESPMLNAEGLETIVVKIAERGDALCQYNLGVMYYNGLGVRQDDTQGVKWLRKAADKGNALAQEWLTRVSSDEERTGWRIKATQAFEQNHYLSYENLKQGAESGNSDSVMGLAICYREGRGVDRNYEKARELFETAIIQGHKYAGYHLVKLYVDGHTQTYNTTITTLSLDDESGTGWIDEFNSIDDFVSDLTNLEFLKYFRNLKSFKLKKGFDVEGKACALLPFPLLPNLETLDLGGCNLGSITGFENLPNLEYLNLSGCANLSSIGGLQSLARLKSLDLENCNKLSSTAVEDISFLQDLLTLNLRYMKQVTSFEPLRSLKNCASLNISGCANLANLNGIQELEQLRELDASACSTLSDISPICELSGLCSLDVSFTNVSNMAGIGSLKELVTLNLSECKSVANIDFLAGLPHLADLNLDNCTGILTLDPLKSTNSLRRLSISRWYNPFAPDQLGPMKLISVSGLSILPQLETVIMKSCPNVRDLNSLGNCPSLKVLDYDTDPYSAKSILAACAVLRKDQNYFQINVIELIKSIPLCKHADTAVVRFAEGFSLSIGEEWAKDAMWKLIAAARKRGDCTPETWNRLFAISLKFGDPTFRELLSAATESVDADQLTGQILEPLLSSMTALPASAFVWATEYVDGLLSQLKMDVLRKHGPVLCLFYASIGRDDRVKDWLVRLTDPKMPVWFDRIQSVLAVRDIAKNDISSAKLRLNAMVVDVEKDRVYEVLALALARQVPTEAGAALEQIVNTIKQSEVARKLAEAPEFTADVKNVYRLLLALETDADALADLIAKLAEQHPDSGFVKELAKQFGIKADSAKTGLRDAITGIIDNQAVADAASKKKLAKFRDEMLADNNAMKMALVEGVVARMVKNGLLDKDEGEDLLKELGRSL